MGLGSPIPGSDRTRGRIGAKKAVFCSILDDVPRVCRDWRRPIEITFDDGNASDVEVALPALRERGLAATFFVCAGRIGEPGYLDADQLRELADAGMSVGSHGWDHVDCGGCPTARPSTARLWVRGTASGSFWVGAYMRSRFPSEAMTAGSGRRRGGPSPQCARATGASRLPQAAWCRGRPTRRHGGPTR